MHFSLLILLRELGKQTLVLFPTIVQKLKPLAIIHSSIMGIKCPVKL